MEIKKVDISQELKNERVDLGYIDGIRGFLTLGILFAHLRTSFLIPLPNIDLSLLTLSTVWVWPSFYSLGMFIALSGYCLMLPVARSQDEWFRGGVADYLQRRARRMLPPYFGALVISLIVCYFYPGNPFLYSKINMSSILTHVFMVHNLFPDYRYSLDAPTWTVGAEWQLYLFFPFILLPIWKKFGIIALILVSIVLGFAPIVLGGDVMNFHTWYISLFSFGMCGASIQFSNRPMEKKIREVISWGKISLVLFMIFGILCLIDLLLHKKLITVFIVPWERSCFFETLTGIAIVFLLVFMGMKYKKSDLNSNLVKSFFKNRLFTFVGTISYSIYLTHFIFLMSFRWFLKSMNQGQFSTVFYMYFLGVPSCIFLGFCYFCLVEKWFMPSHLKKGNS